MGYDKEQMLTWDLIWAMDEGFDITRIHIPSMTEIAKESGSKSGRIKLNSFANRVGCWSPRVQPRGVKIPMQDKAS